jgi:polyisoprenoid-binding protein YceI
MRKQLGFIFIAVSVVAASAARSADWKLDKAGSQLEFVTTYEKASAPGRFTDFDVKLTQFDPQKPAGAQLEVTVKTATADMNSKDINDAIKETEWFDVMHFPQATFVARVIKRTGEGKFVANGKLTIKNVEKDLALPFTWSGNGDGSATMQGELTLNRVTYNIGTGDWSSGDTIGLDVNVRFNLKLQKGK